MEKFQEAGITLVGSVTDLDVQPYWSMDFTQPLALVLGSEEKGLRHTVRQRCDVLTTIPMAGKIASLNVSVAAGILIYEVMRQRQR
jgi:23S rRNA (guanosine2251-2'-O)-methyltransferase